MAQRRPIVFKKLFGIDLVKSLLIGERLHYVSGKSDTPTILPETKPERNICFRQNYIYFLLPETKLSAKRLDCWPTNATKKLIDSSARNPLIYIGLSGGPSGLRPAMGGEGRRENTQTESKTCRLVAEVALSAVRKNPQEPA